MVEILQYQRNMRIMMFQMHTDPLKGKGSNPNFIIFNIRGEYELKKSFLFKIRV